MSQNLANPHDAAWRVRYAHEFTQRLYDKHPPNDQLVPQILAAINMWPLICGCYMGIEQALKLLIRRRNPKTKPERTHDLECLYEMLQPSERDMVAKYYRVYRSLYNFDSGSIPIDTADAFISHIGTGYEAWRYILVEDHADIPKMHLGLMLEIWRALTELAWPPSKPLDTRMEIYFRMEVFDKAEQDEAWQLAVNEDPSEVAFSDIRDWVLRQQGGYLNAGIRLFGDLAKNTWSSDTASSKLREVLFRTACDAVGRLRLPIGQTEEQQVWSRQDIATLLSAIHNAGLDWDKANEVFTHG